MNVLLWSHRAFDSLKEHPAFILNLWKCRVTKTLLKIHLFFKGKKVGAMLFLFSLFFAAIFFPEQKQEILFGDLRYSGHQKN
jgi:hypothetical protein